VKVNLIYYLQILLEISVTDKIWDVYKKIRLDWKCLKERAFIIRNNIIKD